MVVEGVKHIMRFTTKPGPRGGPTG